jgi:hypothetical protein
MWRRAVLALRLNSLQPHDLKRSDVAVLAAAGVYPSEIARRAGHSSAAFTCDRYGHFFPEIDERAAAKPDRVREAAIHELDR